MDFYHFINSSSSLKNHAMLPAFDAILGHKSAHSLETGPVMAEPFISPLLFTITPALSSKYRKVSSFLLSVFLCLMTTAGITFFCEAQAFLSLLWLRPYHRWLQLGVDLIVLEFLQRQLCTGSWLLYYLHS